MEAFFFSPRASGQKRVVFCSKTLPSPQPFFGSSFRLHLLVVVPSVGVGGGGLVVGFGGGGGVGGWGGGFLLDWEP